MTDFGILYPNENYSIRKRWRNFFCKGVPLLIKEIKDSYCLEMLKPCQDVIDSLVTSPDENPDGNSTYENYSTFSRT